MLRSHLHMSAPDGELPVLIESKSHRGGAWPVRQFADTLMCRFVGPPGQHDRMAAGSVSTPSRVPKFVDNAHDTITSNRYWNP